MSSPDAADGTAGARAWALAGLIVAGSVALLACTDRLPQDPAYHHFADTRSLLGIPNFWNVVSNLPFLVIGVYGIVRTAALPAGAADLGPEYRLFFTGVALTGLGSAWYHLAPGNESLVWDRAPMTVAFAGLTGLLAGSYLCRRCAHAVALAWLALGLASVAWWAWTEQAGAGDLRPYALAQFAPLLVLALLLLDPRRGSAMNRCFLGLAAAYLVAKLAEYYDAGLYARLFLSGHSLKHLFAAIGAAAMIAAIPHTPVDYDESPARR